MGHERLPSGAGSHASVKWLARRAARSKIALSVVFSDLHALVGALRIRVVRELADWLSSPPGNERRFDGSAGADDDSAGRWEARGARLQLRRNTDSAGTAPRARACWGDSSSCVLALAIPGERSSRSFGNSSGDSLSSRRPCRSPAERSRLCRLLPTVPRARALSLRYGPFLRTHRLALLFCSPGASHGLHPDGNQEGRRCAH